MALIHHDQAVAIGNGVAHIVGDHHGGQAVLLHNALRGLQDLGGGLGVQGGGVLIQQQQLRLLQGGHQQRQSLALAAGQQAHLGGHPVFQSQVQDFQLLDIALPVRLGNARVQGAALAPTVCQSQIFLDLHGGSRAHHRVLEHPAQVGRPLEFRQTGDVPAVENDGARIHLDGARHGVQHGGFARAVAADDGDEIPVVQGQVQAVQSRFGIHRAGIKGLADVFDLKHSGHLPSLSSHGYCSSNREWTGTGPQWPR